MHFIADGFFFSGVNGATSHMKLNQAPANYFDNLHSVFNTFEYWNTKSGFESKLRKIENNTKKDIGITS